MHDNEPLWRITLRSSTHRRLPRERHLRRPDLDAAMDAAERELRRSRRTDPRTDQFDTWSIWCRNPGQRHWSHVVDRREPVV